MTTKSKSKSKSSTKKTSTSKTMDERLERALASLHAVMPSAADRRKELLAKVAGAVAAGLVATPSPSIASPSSMATAAVDIADEILKKAGIPAVESSAESSSTGASVGAAS